MKEGTALQEQEAPKSPEFLHLLAMHGKLIDGTSHLKLQSVAESERKVSGNLKLITEACELPANMKK